MKTHMRNFINQVKDAIYNPSFYRRLVQEGKAHEGFVHIFKMYIVLSLLWGIFLTATFFAPLLLNIATTDAVRENYPADLVVTIEDGQLSTNQEEPYLIPNPKGEEVENILVIDTEEGITLDTINSYSFFAFITKTDVVVKERKETRMFSLSEAPNVIIDEDQVVEWFKTLRLIAVALYLPLAALVIAVASIGATFYYAVAAIFGALLVLIVTKFRGLKVGYKKAYILSLYAFTPVIVIDLLTDAVGVNTDPVWFSLLIFAVAILMNIKGEEVEE